MKEKEIAPYKGAVVYADTDSIFVKPLCDFFNIDYRNQQKKFKKDPVLKSQVSKKTLESYFGDKKEHLAVSKVGFFRWVQIINVQILPPEMRERFEYFQKHSFDLVFLSTSALVNYVDYVKKEMKELDNLRKEYSGKGNEIKKKKYHIEKVMGMEPGEWKELVSQGEVAQIEGGEK